jgi:hypothetical protein
VTFEQLCRRHLEPRKATEAHDQVNGRILTRKERCVELDQDGARRDLRDRFGVLGENFRSPMVADFFHDGRRTVVFWRIRSESRVTAAVEFDAAVGVQSRVTLVGWTVSRSMREDARG